MTLLERCRPQDNITLYSIGLALALHVALLAIGLKHWQHTKPQAGSEHLRLIHAYLYKENRHSTARGNASHNRQVTEKNQQSQPVSRRTRKTALTGPTQHAPLQISSQTRKTRITQKSPAQAAQYQGGGARDKQGTLRLLTQLHNAIQQHQRYPQAAVMMDWSGIADVAFVLNPDGKLSNVHILHSSGKRALDQAALAAVAAVSPFAPAKRIIKKPLGMQIAIKFQS